MEFQLVLIAWIIIHSREAVPHCDFRINLGDVPLVSRSVAESHEVARSHARSTN